MKSILPIFIFTSNLFIGSYSFNVASEYGKENMEFILDGGRICNIGFLHTLKTHGEYYGDNQHLIATDTIKNAIHHYFSRTYTRARNIADITGDISIKLKELYTNDSLNHQLTVRCSSINSLSTSEQLFIVKDGVIMAQLDNIVLFKLNGSSFSNFMRGRFSTLPFREDRPLYITLSLDWPHLDQRTRHIDVYSAVYKTFQRENSNSIQHLLRKIYDILKDEFNITRLGYNCINHHYNKLSRFVISPLHNEYGFFSGIFY